MTPASQRSQRRIVAGVALALLVFGTLRAAAEAWVCDDAFVSLRYADNLVAGHGLVYNPGERVEGYTNLLWTLALAAALAVGAPDLASAEWMGIACYVALALVLLARSWRRRHPGRPFLPLAAGVVLVSPDFHTWASGGLETSLFALLALAGALLARRAAASRATALSAGLVLSLLVLTRPDGLVFAGVAAAGVAAGTRGSARVWSLALLGGPVLATLAVWAVAKLAYYGELLPTAFYAKSVLHPYYGQGLVYLGLYLARNWFLPVSLVGLLALSVWRRGATPAGPTRPGSSSSLSSLPLVLAASLYLLYVVHVGGDFMYARRIVPAIPLLLVALEEELLRSLPARAAGAAAAAIVVAAALPYPVFDPAHPRIRGVADEPRFYPESVIEKRRLQARVVGDALRGTGARVVFEGGMCVFGYYSRLPYLVEMTGLTQYSLARLPLEERGWIGHEKRPTDAWLTENDIHLIVSQRFPPVSRPPGESLDLVLFRDVALARIHHYDVEVMSALRRVPGVSFVPIEQVLARTRREIARASPERAEELFAWLDAYYFRGAGARGAAEAAALRKLVDARRS